MGIDRRGVQILVAEQFLNGPDVIPALQQVNSKRVTQNMRCARLDDARTTRRFAPLVVRCPLSDDASDETD